MRFTFKIYIQIQKSGLKIRRQNDFILLKQAVVVI